MDLKEQIVQEIDNNNIILYMKGTKEMPMCGFSNSVVQILNHYGIEYKDVNILTDPMIRVKLSEHSGWPTIPQLFVKGKLIGGADITMELHNNGELLDILDVTEENEQD
ncbi:MAG: Grx4 family monothiol glutaredoxin [Candidatus Neomarinimicrobiota bacterium]|nr:Grx4 family monothiol glutaredoxin [Candidatus Neomarinimicrobiota bacterium]MED5265925.1 Grx4 family monothiol glutaredoxin [Candidatus Neomarinimicrobiota bacterium]|tara:strand:+ start:669 stop:995 length:327 start_codon:yes stop_codon:yes gene_type:complete